MGKFKAYVIEKAEKGTTGALTEFDEANLMDGDVTVRVEYSTVNYKDGLAVTGSAPVVRRFPMIAGIDFAGTVESSTNPNWKAGDKVILNGWGLGETHLGAYAEKARVKGDWLVRLPAGMSARDAMAIGTAGYTAMLAVMALERHGLKPDSGPIVVTGAAGGVGSVAIAILAKLGFTVIATTGRTQEADYLKGLGASEILDRKELSAPAKPIAKERWAGGIDFGRLDHARQPPVDDPLWRRHRRLRACRRHGPAGIGRPLHFARRVSLRHRLGHVPVAQTQRGLEKAGKRPRPPKTCRHDHAKSAFPSFRTRPPRSSKARSGAGSWSRSRKRVQDLATKSGHSALLLRS